MDFKYIPSYDECIDIINSNPGFVMKEEIIHGIPIVSFTYRLALIDDFKAYRGARNLRGITFRGDTKELIALPLHKFWNLNENEYTQLDVIKNKKILRVTEKYDGSLVYFFMLGSRLYCKTKFNSAADQAYWAMNIVECDPTLKNSIIKLIKNNYTPIFELISPRNQVVIPYTDEKLKYICARSMVDGTYDFNYIEGCDLVGEFCLDDVNNIINTVKNFYGHEGFVVVFDDQDMVKVKNEEYLKLHKIKSNILNENTVARLALDEELDDIKNSLFSAELDILEYVCNLEKKVFNSYNNFIRNAQKFYELNKNLTRKDYAIKAQNELDRTSFGLSMELYVNGTINEDKFKEIFINKKLWDRELINTV